MAPRDSPDDNRPPTGKPPIEGGAVPLPRHGTTVSPWIVPLAAGEVPPAPPLPDGTIPRVLPPLPEYECGSCGTVLWANFCTEEIECPECDARRCPHCEAWFGASEL